MALQDLDLIEAVLRHAGLEPRLSAERLTSKLSRVYRVSIGQDESVIVKVRPDYAWSDGAFRVQATLSVKGFPCPRPFGKLIKQGMLVTAEQFMPGSPLRHAKAETSAALLESMIDALKDLAVEGPRQVPAWASWNPFGRRLGPDADDGPEVLDDIADDWIDLPAAKVSERLRLLSNGRLTWAHHDWEVQNMAVAQDGGIVVHDWDSVGASSLPSVVGLAAAVWSANSEPNSEPTVESSREYLGYFLSRGFPREWIQEAWLAGLWLRLFNLKKDTVRGRRPTEREWQELVDRAKCVGITDVRDPS